MISDVRAFDLRFGEPPLLNRPAWTEVRGDQLYWGWTPPNLVLPGPESTVTTGMVQPDPDLLLQFLRLAQVPADQAANRIASFAREWGPMEICQPHSLPCHHHSQSTRADVFEGIAGLPCLPAHAVDSSNGHVELWEPLERWQSLANAARGILNVVQALDLGRPTSNDDWLAAFEQKHGRPAWPEGSDFDWRIISRAVSEWQIVGDVRAVTSAEDSPGLPRKRRVGLGGPGLFGALASQLFMAVSRTESLAACTGCGNLFQRTRQDQQYCEDCRASGAAGRRRVQLFRQRRRSSKTKGGKK